MREKYGGRKKKLVIKKWKVCGKKSFIFLYFFKPKKKKLY